MKGKRIRRGSPGVTGLKKNPEPILYFDEWDREGLVEVDRSRVKLLTVRK